MEDRMAARSAEPAVPGRARAGPSLSRAVLTAVAAASAMQCALTVAGVGNTVMTGREADDSGVALFTATLCAGVAIPAVLFLRRRVDGRDLRSMGLAPAGRALRGILGGVIVTVGVGVAVLAVASGAGAITWNTPDPVQLTYFLLTNAVIALLLEALPEEIVYRGYVLTTLSETGRVVLAPVLTTVLFAIMPGFGTVLDRLAQMALGLPAGPIGFAPPGRHPVDYLILMVVFGAALVAVRLATGSVWPGVGVHIGFLTINRIVLEGGSREAGLEARFTDPAVILLIPAYVLVAALVVVAVRIGPRLRGRTTRGGGRHVPATPGERHDERRRKVSG
jgi:membrane protease YdiL (CAAX protease family)